MIKCWICVDTGFMEHFQKFRINGEISEYKTILHCSCEKGQQQKIDYINKKGHRVYTEPISKYFNIFKLQQANKEKFGCG